MEVFGKGIRDAAVNEVGIILRRRAKALVGMVDKAARAYGKLLGLKTCFLG